MAANNDEDQALGNRARTASPKQVRDQHLEGAKEIGMEKARDAATREPLAMRDIDTAASMRDPSGSTIKPNTALDVRTAEEKKRLLDKYSHGQ